MKAGRAAVPADGSRGEIRRYILDNYLRGSAESELRDDDLLFESGLIDSTGAIALILFLEERFGIAVTDAELFPRNFASVGCIHRFVERKLAGRMDAVGG